MELKHEVVYCEDGQLNVYEKDGNGIHLIEIDEGLSGTFASVLLTEKQYKCLIEKLVKFK